MGNNPLKPRPLGSTGLMVSPLGLGTVKLGRNRALKYPPLPTGENFPLPTDDQALALLTQAHALGISLLDTAPAYGLSEERLGTLVTTLQHNISREHWTLCTKVGEEFDLTTAQSSYHFTAAHTRMSVQRSLQRLRIDVLDIVLIHSDGRDEWILNQTDTLDALSDLKTQGLIRAIGISTKSPAGSLRALQDPRINTLMVTLTPGHTDEQQVVEQAARQGVGILLKKSLASGHLNALPGTHPIETMMQQAFAHSGVSSIVMGTTNPAHLTSNASAAAQVLTSQS